MSYSETISHYPGRNLYAKPLPLAEPWDADSFSLTEGSAGEYAGTFAADTSFFIYEGTASSFNNSTDTVRYLTQIGRVDPEGSASGSSSHSGGIYFEGVYF